MSATAVESPAWPRRRWWGAVLGLFAVQVGLLCWFGGHGPTKRRPVSPAPRLQFTHPGADDILTLNDPTLFAQSHPQSFSGAGWMTIPAPEYRPPEWTEPPRWLTLDPQQLGSDLRRFVRANQPLAFVFTAKSDATPSTPEIAPVVSATAWPSALRVAGALASRRWLHPPTLAGQAHSDLLTNSVVQVLVNEDGNVVSHVLLSSSGLGEADQEALAAARAAQFEPLPHSGGQRAPATTLMEGDLVFEWQTLPLPPTNPPPSNP